ncbi:MraY family glycosyltransferase [Sphaerisporangium flaviroseum]|uniref:MraY family glycosyltransferase n=1 Tax=Sphaerisporangium flaviroseum TaxID=509199 RepID=A0ABP7HNY1_9ACTN
MNASTIAMAGAAGFLLTVGTTRALGRLALHWDFTDRPVGYKTHARPVPYLGGVAIMLGTIAPALTLLGVADIRTTAIILAAVAVGLLGLIDDIVPLSPSKRLGVESLAASGVVMSGIQAPVTGGWLDGPLTVMWVVVMTNSVNLLDNMDGALGAVAAVSAATLAATAFMSAEPGVGLLLVALAHACLGFLPHNWAPAKVFMGDAGSLFIGFVLACSAVLLVTGQGMGTMVAGLLLPMFVATVDTGVVLLSRRREGRPLMQGGNDHLSHRLRLLGAGTRLTAVALATLAALAGGLCLAMTLNWVTPLFAAITATGTTLLLIALPQKIRVTTSAVPQNHPTNIIERR